MCGRVIQKTPVQSVASAYGARMEEEVTLFEPGEYTAGGQVLSIEASENGREASLSRWGLPAAWLTAGELLRHARAETAMSKPTFREAARTRRCIVPVDAWIEWGTRPGARRGPHEVRACEGGTTGIAGLWWPSAVRRCPRRLVIITKTASGPPAQIHHRTPMAVLDSDIDIWLDAESELDAVQALLARPSTREGTFEVRAR